ncbi:hypothetical protein L1987_23823 [Smallanthus sonchifolius]|uniref:Uncharacterized protein n=1 Tax=Smallanthus sonchifolius TaxID=185202 RepID=A0ACB9IJC7_9ASTR|nr:hypothetical protein L1987_23823 [Smallanthus sonchifolius]
MTRICKLGFNFFLCVTLIGPLIDAFLIAAKASPAIEGSLHPSSLGRTLASHSSKENQGLCVSSVWFDSSRRRL